MFAVAGPSFRARHQSFACQNRNAKSFLENVHRLNFRHDFRDEQQRHVKTKVEIVGFIGTLNGFQSKRLSHVKMSG